MILNSVMVEIVDWADMAAILHFWFDLTFVTIKHGNRKQVLFGVVQVADHFSASLALGRIYAFYWKSGVNLRLSKRSKQGASLRM